MLKRTLVTMFIDIKLQFRNGFYFASTFLSILLISILWLFPSNQVEKLLPYILFCNLQVNGFYYIGALVLLEKGEGTLEAQVITPLRPLAYLSSKMLSLSLLSLAESVAIVVFSYGFDINIFFLILGILSTTVIFTLLGFLLVIRYDSLNEFLFPSFLVSLPILLPIISIFQPQVPWYLSVHPLQSPLEILRAGISCTDSSWISLHVLLSLTWITLLLLYSIQKFHHFIVMKQGVHHYE